MNADHDTGGAPMAPGDTGGAPLGGKEPAGYADRREGDPLGTEEIGSGLDWDRERESGDPRDPSA